MKCYHYDFEFCFHFQPIKSEKNVLNRNSTLQNVFSSMLLYCFLTSAKSAFFKMSCRSKVKISKYRTPVRNIRFRMIVSKYTFQNDQIPVFPGLIFVINNKYHFLCYFHDRIFLRFKMFNPLMPGGNKKVTHT